VQRLLGVGAGDRRRERRPGTHDLLYGYAATTLMPLTFFFSAISTPFGVLVRPRWASF
jgi:hypothetical protein